MGTLKRFKAAMNYRIGNLAKQFGYTVIRTDRVPTGNMNLLEVAFCLLKLIGKERIHILQVGAFDGLERDPLVRILRNESVEAILMEPQGEPFRALEKTYRHNPRIRLENAALSDRSGEGTLYVPTQNGASPRASLLAQHRFRFSGSHYHESPIRLVTLQDLLTKYGWHSFDLLQIDTEGYDLKILQMVFGKGLEPHVINLESFHLSREERAELCRALMERDYYCVDWGFDTLAIRNSSLNGLFERI